MLDDMSYGVGGLVGAVEEFGSAAVVFEAVEYEAGEVFDVEAGFDGVFASGEGEHMAFETLEESGVVAVLAVAEDDAWSEDGELAGRVGLLPLTMDVLGDEF